MCNEYLSGDNLLNKMPLGKRKRSAARTYRSVVGGGTMRRGYSRYARRIMGKVQSKLNRGINRKVNKLYSMIETKEGCRKSSSNVNLPHNNITVVQANSGGALNVFASSQAAGDPMEATMNRVGDKISVKGIMVKGFLENAANRPRVHYRIMLLRGAKGETFDRSTIFKGDADNKIIDQVNTERFTIVAQKVFNIGVSNPYAFGVVSAAGEPKVNTGPDVTNVTAHPGAIGTKVFKMWIPGRKFGTYGSVQYENASTTQVKFYDYRLVILAYDWYGTPQDVNNVGKINELYCKIYFKDA